MRLSHQRLNLMVLNRRQLFELIAAAVVGSKLPSQPIEKPLGFGIDWSPHPAQVAFLEQKGKTVILHHIGPSYSSAWAMKFEAYGRAYGMSKQRIDECLKQKQSSSR
jgi:hypothetical protein